MKLGFFNHAPSGCYWYRIKHPIDALASSGVPIVNISLDEDVDDDITAFQLYGAYPFSFSKVIKWMKEEKKKIVYDADDAMALIDQANPWYYQVKKDLGSVREILEAADHITVSTPIMGEHIRKMTDKPITVIPNCYVPSEWTFPRPKREGLRIGFAGSSSHMADLIHILPVIKKLQEAHDFTFVIFGFGINPYKDWYRDFRYSATEEGVKRLDEFDRALQGVKYEWVPFVNYDVYPSVLTNISLDIGICPLLDTPFNRCRSACKAMEYTLSGALSLATNIPPYNQEPTSTLVLDWEKALTHFIEHPDEIESNRLKHLKWIEENRKMESQIEALKKVYEI